MDVSPKPKGGQKRRLECVDAEREAELAGAFTLAVSIDGCLKLNLASDSLALSTLSRGRFP